MTQVLSVNCTNPFTTLVNATCKCNDTNAVYNVTSNQCLCNSNYVLTIVGCQTCPSNATYTSNMQSNSTNCSLASGQPCSYGGYCVCKTQYSQFLSEISACACKTNYGTQSTSNGTKCVLCPSHSAYLLANNRTYCSCSANNYWDNTSNVCSCSTTPCCPIDSQYMNHSCRCTDKKKHYDFISNTCLCSSGYYSRNYYCISCPINSTAISGSNNCSCASGSFSSQYNACTGQQTQTEQSASIPADIGIVVGAIVIVVVIILLTLCIIKKNNTKSPIATADQVESQISQTQHGQSNNGSDIDATLDDLQNTQQKLESLYELQNPSEKQRIEQHQLMLHQQKLIKTLGRLQNTKPKVQDKIVLPISQQTQQQLLPIQLNENMQQVKQATDPKTQQASQQNVQIINDANVKSDKSAQPVIHPKIEIKLKNSSNTDQKLDQQIQNKPPDQSALPSLEKQLDAKQSTSATLEVKQPQTQHSIQSEQKAISSDPPAQTVRELDNRPKVKSDFNKTDAQQTQNPQATQNAQSSEQNETGEKKVKKVFKKKKAADAQQIEQNLDEQLQNQTNAAQAQNQLTQQEQPGKINAVGSDNGQQSASKNIPVRTIDQEVQINNEIPELQDNYIGPGERLNAPQIMQVQAVVNQIREKGLKPISLKGTARKGNYANDEDGNQQPNDNGANKNDNKSAQDVNKQELEMDTVMQGQLSEIQRQALQRKQEYQLEKQKQQEEEQRLREMQLKAKQIKEQEQRQVYDQEQEQKTEEQLKEEYIKQLKQQGLNFDEGQFDQWRKQRETRIRGVDKDIQRLAQSTVYAPNDKARGQKLKNAQEGQLNKINIADALGINLGK